LPEKTESVTSFNCVLFNKKGAFGHLFLFKILGKLCISTMKLLLNKSLPIILMVVNKLFFAILTKVCRAGLLGLALQANNAKK